MMPAACDANEPSSATFSVPPLSETSRAAGRPDDDGAATCGCAADGQARPVEGVAGADEDGPVLRGAVGHQREGGGVDRRVEAGCEDGPVAVERAGVDRGATVHNQ